MKKIILREVLVFLLISVSAIIYFSCDDSGVAPEEPKYCITGRITNWSQGEKTLYAVVSNQSFATYPVAGAPIDSNGSFSICFPYNLPDSSLVSAGLLFTAGCSGGTVNYNPPDVRGNVIMKFEVRDGSNVLGDIRLNNYDTISPGAYSILYLNTNKSAVATGQKICGIDTMNFNVDAVNGWALVVKRCTKISGSSVTYQFNNFDPGGAVWRFY